MRNKKLRLVIFVVTLVLLCSMGTSALASCPDCGINMKCAMICGSFQSSPWFSNCPQYPTACDIYNVNYYTPYNCQSCGETDWTYSQHLHRRDHDTCAAPDVDHCPF